MRLYAVTLSPFAARARLALRVKGVEYEMLAPLGGSTRSPEFLAMNPIGKLPVLVTEDGLAIAESETIIDFLDDRYPSPPLMPESVADRVQMRNAIRTFELYVTPAMERLFKQMDPASRDNNVVNAEIALWRSGLSLTAQFLNDAPFAIGNTISKADCMLLPGLLLCEIVAAIFGLDDSLAEFPTLSGYRDKARQEIHMGAIWTETSDALAAMRAGA